MGSPGVPYRGPVCLRKPPLSRFLAVPQGLLRTAVSRCSPGPSPLRPEGMWWELLSAALWVSVGRAQSGFRCYGCGCFGPQILVIPRAHLLRGTERS
ncbi:hypothetical protein NDU88_009011 [Pleurodeles waltl]|uniref:Uncharacterized protein n=1 Tax=Pleurodeles waltl TaxID=8319 RepID=A0AAV7RXC8_PLEWA|nr:hypothetical protein NDU88_009011 [Pleurodeles waltl]